MTHNKPTTLTFYAGLALISGGVLALQVIFTRVFSLMIWHHFTYLVIGVALLGGGAAGTFLAVRQWAVPKLEDRLGKLAAAFGVAVLATLGLILLLPFDPLRARDLVRTIFGLTVYFAALFTTFFLGALVIVAVFRLRAAQADRLYFADLFGAGVATVSVVGVVWVIGGPSAIVLVSVLATLGGLLLGQALTPAWRRGLQGLTAAQVAILIWTLVNPIQLPVPESKDLGWALSNFNLGQPAQTRWNPVARVDVLPAIEVSEPMIVGGISSRYLQQADPSLKYQLHLVTLDGTSMTGIYRFDGDLSRFEFLKHAIISAPYQIGLHNPSTLKIGVGGGLDILLAKLYGSSRIVAIELNADVVDLLREDFAEYSGQLAYDPAVTLVTAEGRSFLMRDTAQYDIIQGIGLDNVAALSSGAYVLAESYLYTVESIGLSLDRLSPAGVFSWTLNDSEPPRTTVRLAGLAAEALRDRGVTDPARHIAIVTNEAGVTSTVLVQRQPFAEAQLVELRAWAEANGFRLLHDPFIALDTPHAQYLNAADPRAFEAAYAFQVFPVADDRPFFYNYFRWEDMFNSREVSGSVFARFPIGNLILLTLATLSVLSAVAFIVAPLYRYQRSGLRAPGAGSMLVYFSMLGIGYIFIQVVLIQRFTLFIGYPTVAITTTIFSMLCFSALGSLTSRRLIREAGHLRLALAVIVGLTLVYVLVLPPVLAALLTQSDLVRVLLSVALVGPLSFVMGMPFPTGMRLLGERAEALVPWAWGMNGVFSVLGSVVVILVSMFASFTASLTVAALFYGAAAVVAPALWQVHVAEAAPAPLAEAVAP